MQIWTVVDKSVEDAFVNALIEQNLYTAKVQHAIAVLKHVRANDGIRKISGGKKIQNYYHEMTVAYSILMWEGFAKHNDHMRENIIVVALLHDVLEDDKISVEELQQAFDEIIMYMLGLLNKNGDWYGGFDMISSFKCSLIVKCFDRLTNLDHAIGVFSEARMGRYYKETKDMYASFSNSPLYYEFSNLINELNI